MPSSFLDQEEDVPLSPEQLAAKLRKFEGYKEDFAADIKRLEERRQRLQDDLSEYSQLVERVEKLITDGTSGFETRVDVGCDVTVAARVPDCKRIFVAIGLGFHVELELAEVSALVTPRCKHLEGLVVEVDRKLSDARSCAHAFDSSLQLLKAGEE
ncbi:hypothetical protein VOLCADRAFT_104116 [Volvox carteri f. nagariensis]|uniref:Uncharacterized protein n=1 Tax=Volvox carteri f. nagariensis TaxID=3068 RepID=D8TRC2_VOLCA|nr:uncharacterized protein VOLCADRAFT_104116 [Volvox carteri f. nagariensis]EFJ49866.1 hypothetical protein VOLCADRAFT_104116 [Volvox carteri f. nagariensis]|eukprot:XP_002948931.1 hypothetical protein VOLCADRAFT_104116 [Volvox carteri f. nagariensis]